MCTDRIRWIFKVEFLRFGLLFLFACFLTSTEVTAQNFWQQTNGPYGGTINTLAIDSSGHIFAGARGGGVFRSIDNGENWKVVNAGLTNFDVLSIAINNTNGYIFAGTRAGIFRSANNGTSWKFLNTVLEYPWIYALAIDSNGHVFAGTHYGVYKSLDNGDTWTFANTGLTTDPESRIYPDVFAFAITSSQKIFAGTSYGIFCSVNNGASWTAVNTSLPSDIISALATNSRGYIFAGTYNGGMFRSANDGMSWTPINIGLMNHHVVSVAINQTTGHIFAGTYDGGVFHSTNNGENWTPANAGLTNSSANALAINSNGDIFAGTFHDGMFRSTNNGENWTTINNGLANLVVMSLAIRQTTGHMLLGTNAGEVFRSTDNGRSWTLTNTGLTSNLVRAIAINSSGHIFAGTRDGVFRSTDNGESWTAVNTGLTNFDVFSIAINTTNGYIFAGTRGGIFRSINNGDSWLAISVGLTYALSINAEGHIFAGTDFEIVRSDDNGDNWMTVMLFDRSNIPNTSLVISSSGYIFAGIYDSGVFRSTDNGTNWTSVNNGLTNTRVLSLVIDTKGYVFAGTDGGGVFRSTDNGEGWIAVNAGLTNTRVNTFTINSNDLVFAGTSGNGVFVLNLPPIIAHTPSSTQQNEGQKIDVMIKIIDEDVTFSGNLNYRKGGRPRFVAFPFSAKGDSFAATIPADSVTSRGVEYFITATDADNMTTREPRSGFFSIQVNVPAGVKKEHEQDYGGEQTAYRLISMPLDFYDKSAKVTIEDNFGSMYNKKKWRLFTLNAEKQLYVEFPDFPDTLKMMPGKAFLLIIKDAGKRIYTGAGKSIRTDKSLPIPLYPEWNFIGNPFTFSISFKNLSLKSRQLLTLRYHEGTWRDPILRKRLAIQPFEGYAVFNPSESIDTLLINPDLSSSTSSLAKEFASTIEEKMQWSIRILAQCQEALDEDNRAAIVSGASSSWDELDQPEPPVIGEYVSVYFPHPEWGKLAKVYCTDVRPMTSDNGHRTSNGELWPFEVKTNIRDKVNLTFEGVDEVPKELEVWLVDDALKITQNLRENNHYSLGASEQPKPLKLVVGKGEFVGEKLADAQKIPATYELSQNFPNPFNPATTIRYGLPQAGRVTLKIYNLLGAEVATLVNDELKAAGYHAAVWDGRNAAGRKAVSGIYFSRMRVGPSTSSGSTGSGQVFVQTRKMILLE